MDKKVDKNYPGNKGGQGIREFLTNYIPKSKRYFSLFYGAGGFENCKYMKKISWICSEKNENNKKYQTNTAVIAYNDYRSLLVENTFTSDDFIFADPPYRFENRLSKKKIYKYEFDEAAHIEFLSYMRNIKCKILITHPKNKIYDKKLKGFLNKEFKYMSHGGWFKDSIYFNYDPGSIDLVTYQVLGANAMNRQRIKRKRSSMLHKIRCLPKLQQKALIFSLKKEGIIK